MQPRLTLSPAITVGTERREPFPRPHTPSDNTPYSVRPLLPFLLAAAWAVHPNLLVQGAYVCVCVRSRVLPLSARKQCFDENRKDSCFLFFFSLESLSVSLSVSPVLSNEAVVQLCDGLFANFFFLECGLQKWGCEGEGAQKAAVLFLLLFLFV